MFRAVQAVTVQDGKLVVEDRPDPEPGLGEVLIRVRGAGINGADMLQRRGAYPAPPGSPPTSRASSWPARSWRPAVTRSASTRATA